MPQLDRLLSVMVSNRAQSLRLVENELASLVKDGATVPVTKQALGAAQLLGLLREIAPPDALRHLDAGSATEFQYRTGDTVFNARATNEGGKWLAAITASEPLTSGVGRPTPSMAASRVQAVPSADGVAAATHAATTATARSADDPTARAAMDNLLRQLVEQGGSDLHLRCDEPPI
ncbi:MAG: twitching motility protein, partial [Geminicoccaceae bacterium]|nr:twitching motility protein [Geminicoccaceae bacterium]